MVNMQMLSGINLGLTTASGALSLVVILFSGWRAFRLVLAGKFGRSDVVCQISVYASCASLCWLGRRVFLLVTGSPKVAAQPQWAQMLASCGSAFSIALLVTCLMYRAEHVAPGRGKVVAAWSIAFVALAILGGALSS